MADKGAETAAFQCAILPLIKTEAPWSEDNDSISSTSSLPKPVNYLWVCPLDPFWRHLHHPDSLTFDNILMC